MTNLGVDASITEPKLNTSQPFTNGFHGLIQLETNAAAHRITGEILFMSLRRLASELSFRSFLVRNEALFHDWTSEVITSVRTMIEHYAEERKSARPWTRICLTRRTESPSDRRTKARMRDRIT